MNYQKHCIYLTESITLVHTGWASARVCCSVMCCHILGRMWTTWWRLRGEERGDKGLEGKTWSKIDTASFYVFNPQRLCVCQLKEFLQTALFTAAKERRKQNRVKLLLHQFGLWILEEIFPTVKCIWAAYHVVGKSWQTF